MSDWTDMPPVEFHGVASALVVYADRSEVMTWCGRAKIGCYINGVVYLPVQCGPGGRVMRDETVDIARLARYDPSYCGSLKAHEFGHVLGWRH